jgi:hypothetical protein
MKPDTRTGLWTQMAYAIDQLRPASSWPRT